MYTNVPVIEAIDMAAEMLFDPDRQIPMEVSKDTFKSLAKLACTDILLLTHKGYMKHIEGLGMGNSIAGPLANIFMSSFDNTIKGTSRFYRRYVDDLIRIIKRDEVEQTFAQINDLHQNLTFTMEEEIEGSIPFLDMRIHHLPNGHLEGSWYMKPTETNVTLNFQSLAPLKYKRSTVISFVHRIFNATTTRSSGYRLLSLLFN